MTFFDCHTHTEFSACAEDVTLRAYARIARTTSAQFAVTDHSAQIFYPPDNRWGFWSDDAVEVFESCRDGGRERIAEYIRTVRAAQCGAMLVGTELDVLPDGRMVFPEGMLEELDVVLGAVHSLPAVRHERPVEEITAQFRRQVEALAGHGMQVLAHPFRLLLDADVPVSDELLRWTVQCARERGFALEINSHKQHAAADLRMVRLAVERDVPLVIGTDTHRMSEFGDFSYHRTILQDAGLESSAWSRHLWRPVVHRRDAAAN